MTMRFGEHFLDELKARIRPSDVVGRHVKLKRQGREFAGLSPFTNEKTPSFFVNDEKGFYHCFSSGKHGDAISFLMEVEGLSFPEAVERLANMAGMALPDVDPKAEARAAHNKKTINWMEAAQQFFEKSLRRSGAEHARDYLKSRGLTGEECKRFGIGYAPDSFNALRDELIQQGASESRLIEAGLLIKPDHDVNKKPWDRFRNRIMFPITDARGRMIAFGGRALSKDDKAKYLNSPETNLFHKGHVLYRYANARKALHTPKNGARGLIVAEGYMDVIALAKYGFEHACAPLGTALTQDQLSLLWRAGPEPTLCFDGDKAGVRAAFRSIERALPLIRPGQTLRFALLPDGQDPDDLLRAKGASAMRDVLDKSVSLVDMLWRREVEKERLDTPEAKAGLKERIFAALREIEHEGVRDQYKTALLAKFDADYGRPKWTPNAAFSKYKNEPWKHKRKPNAQQKAEMEASALHLARERRVIGALLEWPELLKYVDQTVFSLIFHSSEAASLQNSLLNYWQNTIAVDKRALHAHIEQDELAQSLKSFKRERGLIMAAMGGVDADLKTRTTLWLAEARAMQGHEGASDVRQETRGRMADSVRSDNSDGLNRLLRLTKTERD
ncbi:MAG TPA: DNA primase [Hellea balneolensis]|uniref:DNA primase n=1 Tax=Hellea balneolensis TaxID=287478 RepID=A0A7C3C8U8_9PROT|nr:DNA primase [Hellea balneolensis]